MIGRHIAEPENALVVFPLVLQNRRTALRSEGATLDRLGDDRHQINEIVHLRTIRVPEIVERGLPSSIIRNNADDDSGREEPTHEQQSVNQRH